MKRILLVEDSEIVRKAIKLFLEAQGYVCEEAEHGAVAFVRLEETHEIDLVISDNQMPVMTGLELLKNVAGHPKLHLLPFILNSGNVTEALREQALQNGAYAVLSKPTDFSELTRAIKAALGTS
jgi:CheY-like chemotaxis protein